MNNNDNKFNIYLSNKKIYNKNYNIKKMRIKIYNIKNLIDINNKQKSSKCNIKIKKYFNPIDNNKEKNLNKNKLNNKNEIKNTPILDVLINNKEN